MNRDGPRASTTQYQQPRRPSWKYLEDKVGESVSQLSPIILSLDLLWHRLLPNARDSQMSAAQLLDRGPERDCGPILG